MSRMQFRVREDDPSEGLMDGEAAGQINIYPGFGHMSREAAVQRFKLEGYREDDLLRLYERGEKELVPYVAVAQAQVPHLPLRDGYDLRPSVRKRWKSDARPLGLVLCRVRDDVCQLVRSVVDETLNARWLTGRIITKLQKEQQKRTWQALRACVPLEDEFTADLLQEHGFRFHRNLLAHQGQSYRLTWSQDMREAAPS